MAHVDEELRIADVYAEALFELAQEAGRVADVRAELDELVRLLELAPGFERFLTSRGVDDDARAVGLEQMFRGKLSDVVLNTLLVMNRRDRCELLPALQRCFMVRQAAAANEVEVTATSAVELTDVEKEKAEQIAAEVSGKRPLMRYAVDPGILGGLILQVGALRLDNSVRRHLQGAREQLLERAERGLRIAAETE
jgi:F-type H+-transporting ATPase subunit delta